MKKPTPRKVKLKSVTDIQAEIHAAEGFLGKSDWVDDVPRFRAGGMNQSELIRHIFAAGFNRGVDYARTPEGDLRGDMSDANQDGDNEEEKFSGEPQ